MLMQLDPIVSPRNIWTRALWMVLLGMAFQLASAFLCLLAFAQWLLCLLNQPPNLRLVIFARSLGLYLRQIAEFVGFATQALPFPFAEWPSGVQLDAKDTSTQE